MSLSINQPASVQLHLPKAKAFDIAGIPAYVFAVTLSSLLVIVGILWDISWHRTIGRDAFLSPPHLLIYMGAVFGGLFSGLQVLWNSFNGSADVKASLIKVWGFFYSSLGAMFCIWGAVAMLTSAPFDDWWHNTYGLDVVILSPPHTVLALGMLFMQVGACVSISKYINTSGITLHKNPKTLNILRGLFVVSSSSLLAMIAVLLTEETLTRNQRGGMYYLLISIVALLFLPAFKKAVGLKWGATSIAAGYMAIILLCNWILQLFHAEPKLGPILNHVTNFQPITFPTVLFIPALAIDFFMNKTNMNAWLKALFISSAFVLLLLAIQYPLSGFILQSPLSRNWFWGAYNWDYQNSPDWEFRYKFMPQEIEPFAQLAKMLLITMAVGTGIARLSMRWGVWFNKIYR